MRAKNVEFEVTYLERGETPGWLLEISPHGLVPVLKVGNDALFESNAIVEYLDETIKPRLHPEDPIKRAHNRAWTDFVSECAGTFGRFNYAKSKESQNEAIKPLSAAIANLEEALTKERGNDGPYFNGDTLCLVDAAYAPFLQRFQIVENLVNSGLLEGFPLVTAWSNALMENENIKSSAPPDFDRVFEENLIYRQTYAATLLDIAKEDAR
jgi:glutathione S-transferase